MPQKTVSQIGVTLDEHVCNQCEGTGDDGLCACWRGFNPGMRWSAYRNDLGKLDPEAGKYDRRYITRDTTKNNALADIYRDAYARKVDAINLTTKWHDGHVAVKTIHPRYTAIRKAEAEEEKRKVEAEEEKRKAEAQRRAHLEGVRLLQHDPRRALWSLNRHAKRLRDRNVRHRGIYELKNQALHHMLAEGLLTVGGYHRIGGLPAELLCGGGYTFHRPCSEPEGSDVQSIGDEIEAKPVSTEELQPQLARDVVEAYLLDKPHVEVYRWPDTRMCYICGTIGHIADECPSQCE
jgi:hypothetical protein